MPPASIRLTRPLEWMDTDASGVWHYATVIRCIEQAELALYRRLGLMDEFVGHAPRVHLEIDLHAPVRFGEDITTTFAIERVGRTSVTCVFTLASPAGEVATGRVVSVLTDVGGAPQQVPEAMRERLLAGGDQTAPTS
jgi:acyl-CoA thioester hydrolase